jgi:tRNA isopentenyl-2-thiomethyl-A-37 hydroxylase MiaE
MKRQQLQSRPDLAVPLEVIEHRIFLIRGQKVMLDTDLAALYQVPTKVLNQAVKRNPSRFPADFMFRLSPREADLMRSQIVTASKRNIRYQPYAFSEHGVAMLSSVLNSERAVQMNSLIIRAFVKLRDLLATHKDLAARIEKIEATQGRHASVINLLAEEIERLKRLPVAPPKRRIGFEPRSDP